MTGNAENGRESSGPVDRQEGLTSIVVLAYNALRYTRACVESILRYTEPPFELVLVDNGSTDGTYEYFCSLPGERVVVRNSANLGPAAGYNSGWKVSRGTTLVFLQNDLVATPNWLSNQLTCLRSDPSIGLVVPCCNGQQADLFDQLIPDVPYLADSGANADDAVDTQALERFAEAFNRPNPGRWREVNPGRVFGLCFVIPRRVLEAVGGYDEEFKRFFEDMDLAIRTANRGFRVMLAGDAYLHHYGHRTFIENRLHFMGLHAQDAPKFWARYGWGG